MKKRKRKRDKGRERGREREKENRKRERESYPTETGMEFSGCPGKSFCADLKK